MAALGAALLLAGCGGSSERAGSAAPAASGGDVAGGAKVFASAGCGGCHTLAAAKANGNIGPDLDQLRPDAGTVARQVATGGNGMPPFAKRLSETQIEAVAAFVSASTHGPDSGSVPKPTGMLSAALYKPDKTKLSGCAAGAESCYQQAFANVSYYDGPKQALKLFAEKMASDRNIEAGCHRIAHAIGAGGLKHYNGNVSKAFADGAATCWSGYYHGILERAFAGVPRDKVGAVARKLCSDPSIHKSTFIYYQCVHGLGHGLMIYSGYDLPLALRICDQLQTSWDQTSCTGGVFMENISSSYGVKSPWLKDSDLLYPCDVVSQKHKVYCYLMATSRILEKNGYNWQNAAKICHSAEQGWIATCFQSFGRDASGQTRQNPQKIVALCKIAGDMESQCIYGAARDMTSNYASGKQASVMCNLAPLAMRGFCFNGIGTIIGSFTADSAGRRAQCAALSRRYLADCARGSGA